MGLARHAQITWVNLQYFCDILRKVRNEVRDLTALAGSNTTLTIYFTSSVLPLLTLFLPSIWNLYQAFSSSDCLCSISSLLF